MNTKQAAIEAWIGKFAEYLLLMLAVLMLFGNWWLGFVPSEVSMTVSAVSIIAAGVVLAVKQTVEGVKQQTDKLPNLELQLTAMAGRLAQLATAAATRDRTKVYEALTRRYQEVKQSIDVVSYYSLKESSDAKRLSFYQMLERAMRDRQVYHQRIIWNVDQLHWLQQMLDNGWDNLNEFSVKFLNPAKCEGPLTTFDLLDERLVIFAQNWAIHGHVELESEEVGGYFRTYFVALWDQAEWLKRRGQPADHQRIKKLIQDLSEGS